MTSKADLQKDLKRAKGFYKWCIEKQYLKTARTAKITIEYLTELIRRWKK